MESKLLVLRFDLIRLGDSISYGAKHLGGDEKRNNKDDEEYRDAASMADKIATLALDLDLNCPPESKPDTLEHTKEYIAWKQKSAEIAKDLGRHAYDMHTVIELLIDVEESRVGCKSRILDAARKESGGIYKEAREFEEYFDGYARWLNEEGFGDGGRVLHIPPPSTSL
ncbi:hypothetical protein BU26DRAFT_567766 [Trematosphaeria pertusa]|uniref:Uncharacterized protein n=1 Tax=Trematosphaeria pertusa TaxID=390896 RepID=A0A6A6I7T9_9PLEO|nr:uncharacterized protein BU26DRAFT_567766 [Trematosphaeria pertusa]KAF2246279.1 hypothetical protein BU26DRAFT_567766 [Trematosphaeria pertusa]